MRFKAGVDIRGVHPRVWQVLVWLDYMHHAFTSDEVTVTSMRRQHVPGNASKHSPPPPEPITGYWLKPEQWEDHYCTAWDIRRWALDGMKKAEEFCRYVQSEHGDEIGVVLEPEWLTARQVRLRGGLDNIAGHIHFQLKHPIQWRIWNRYA